MKIAIAMLALLVLSAAPVKAQDATTVQQLDGALKNLVGRADAAVVEILGPAASPFPGYEKAREAMVLALAHYDRVRSGTPKVRAAGVLVGTPPVLVTAASAVRGRREIEFRLADGTEGKAILKAEDPDLGVAVFTLPPEVAEGRSGLEVDPTPRVKRGSIVLVPGPGQSDVDRPLGLLLARGSEPFSGWFVVDGLSESCPEGCPAIGSDGRLRGISAKSPEAKEPTDPKGLTY
jgi:hypothetical protein